MATTDIAFGSPVEVPTPDATPTWVDPPKPADEDVSYPGATTEAPYGFKPDGTPYKRRPYGSRTGNTSGKRSPANPSTAKSAAGLLARLNLLVGLAIHTSGLEDTALELKRANEQFEELAYEALLADPQLCKKILGAGATSGKAGLVMAYSMLGISIAPTARLEIIERRKAKESEND